MTVPFYLKQENLYAIPVLHYTMECAAEVFRAFHHIQPDAVAVELPETFNEEFLRGAARLPDVSLLKVSGSEGLNFLIEPTDPACEGLRCALENDCAAYCIDLDVMGYPAFNEPLPDPYAISRIGLKRYYEAFTAHRYPVERRDRSREMAMARRLKELSLQYDRVLFIGGMHHIARVLEGVKTTRFSPLHPPRRGEVSLLALSEKSERDVTAESGWIHRLYEIARASVQDRPDLFLPDRQRALYHLFQLAGERYKKRTGFPFPGYHMRNLMKFSRNYALTTGRLLPDLFQLIEAARGCVDDDYAYRVWELATAPAHHDNIDNLPVVTPSVEEIWGKSRKLQFQLRKKREKGLEMFHQRRDKGKKQTIHYPPSALHLCSHQPEDLKIEQFGTYLRSRGRDLVVEREGRSVPFTSSLEDGIDVRETIRKWYEGKVYVQVAGRPPGTTGSVVVIFDDDTPLEKESYEARYPWCMTWLGEHTQESDMAFYATDGNEAIIGPGISRCEYGGFFLSYPPRRLDDVWSDPDYAKCRTKAEVLLMAAIDYTIEPIVVYVAAKPPRSLFKRYAAKYGKKLTYLPLGQFSPLKLQKLQRFHVLEGQEARKIAGDYIE